MTHFTSMAEALGYTPADYHTRPAEFMLDLQRIFADNHFAILHSLAREYQAAKETADLAVREASQPE